MFVFVLTIDLQNIIKLSGECSTDTLTFGKEHFYVISLVSIEMQHPQDGICLPNIFEEESFKKNRKGEWNETKELMDKKINLGLENGKSLESFPHQAI